MRRLIRRLRNERGATAVLVAILLVPLVGFAAVAVDVGALYYERAQLQHAADSAAMAVASKCSVAHCPADTGLATSFANDNAKDGAVSVDRQVIDTAARTVLIDVTTLEPDGDTALSHPFAAAAGFDVTNTTVFATATAKWAAGGVALPLSFTLCEFDRSGVADGNPRWITYDKGSKNPCKKDDVEVPGGFGWLDLKLNEGSKKDPVGCVAEIGADGNAGSETGNDGLPNTPLCHSVFTPALAGQTVYLPLADTATDQGSKGIWHIKQYGKFTLHAWKFSGGKVEKLPEVYLPETRDAANQSCTGNCRGVLVEFQGFAPLGTVPGTDISTTIALIE